MAFTYDPTTTAGQVRFYIGDTDATAPKFEDAELAAIITMTGGTVGAAVVACIGNLISRLAVPTFQADWLKVDTATAVKTYQGLLDIYRARFGITDTYSGVIVPLERRDSDEVDE